MINKFNKRAAMNSGALGLYIHIPFCKSKCLYCDFYSITAANNILDQYFSALIREIKYYSTIYRDKYIIDTVYIGGGTPTLLSPLQFDELMQNVKKYFRMSRSPEISTEANPESLTEEHLKIFKKCSINRISMGVQAFNDKVLKTIGRITDEEEIARKLRLISKYKVNDLSLDLILGLPFQDTALFKEDLRKAMNFKIKHLSLYSLALKETCPLYTIYKEKRDIFMDDDLIADNYIFADKFLSAHGLKRYEISNFSLEGNECRHNLKYWRLNPYLGIGASAVSTIENVRWKNIEDVSEYIKNVNAGVFEKNDSEKIDDLKSYNEKIMLGLRLRNGINLGALSRQEQEFLAEKKEKINFIKKLKYLQEKNGRLFLTVKGVMISNSIISEIIM